jgi:CheY-like chemotaxis protein
MGPARILINLAAPGALAALGALRSAGCTSRAWGFVADHATHHALPLGMIEPAVRPLDLDAVLASLGHYATRGMRVVAVGAEVEARGDLRRTLTRHGISVSMAWDAKQASDLFTMVKPDLVILDLALPHESQGIVAALAGLEPVPNAVLLSGSDDVSEFVRLLADPAYALRMLPFEQCLVQMAARSAAIPAGRTEAAHGR